MPSSKALQDALWAQMITRIPNVRQNRDLGLWLALWRVSLLAAALGFWFWMGELVWGY